jgi:hypothetical protein
VGIILGLIYGWVIDPVQFVDTTPETLRADYRADYVLMTAEIYQAEINAELAAQRLALLGSEPPLKICEDALEFARAAGFSEADLSLMQKLTLAMQTYQPPEANP